MAAPESGYTAGTAWWGSPVGSEDEEKPLHNQAGAPETQGNRTSEIQQLRYYSPLKR